MLRSTRRGLETWHGRDRVTLADERARQQGTQTSTYTGAPVLDPTWERPEAKFLPATRQKAKVPFTVPSLLPPAPAVGWVARPPTSAERGCDFAGSAPARLEPRVVQHGSPVTSRPVNHAEPHETSRPAQGLRCSCAVLTARENETNTSGLTTVLKVGAAGAFAQF